MPSKAAVRARERLPIHEIWEHAGVGLWLGGSDGKCLDSNPTLRRMAGDRDADLGTLANLQKLCADRLLRITLAPFSDGRVLGTIVDARPERDWEAASHAFTLGVGEHLLEQLTLSLGHLLPADYAFIGKLTREPKDHIHIMALCDHGQIAPPSKYPLAGAPSARVIASREICSHESGVSRLFPEDRHLSTIGAEAYVGTPLVDSLGSVRGLLAIVDGRPLADPDRTRRLVKMYAVRAALEVERMMIDEHMLKLASST
jgi:hypothetical protein